MSKNFRKEIIRLMWLLFNITSRWALNSIPLFFPNHSFLLLLLLLLHSFSHFYWEILFPTRETIEKPIKPLVFIFCYRFCVCVCSDLLHFIDDQIFKGGKKSSIKIFGSCAVSTSTHLQSKRIVVFHPFDTIDHDDDDEFFGFFYGSIET